MSPPEMTAPLAWQGERRGENQEQRDEEHSVVREQRVNKVLAETPVRWRGILNRAYDGTGGRTNAITAMCLHCVGYQPEEVRHCTGYSCPLWKYRPYAPSAARPEKLASRELSDGTA